MPAGKLIESCWYGSVGIISSKGSIGYIFQDNWLLISSESPAYKSFNEKRSLDSGNVQK